MKNLSLKKKLVLMCFVVCSAITSIAYWGIRSERGISNSYRSVGIEQMPKVQLVSQLIASFRLIRINARSLGLNGNTEADQRKYIKLTRETIKTFEEKNKKFMTFSFNEQEKEYLVKLNKGWDSVLVFTENLLSKYENPTDQSLKEGSDMIRRICPIEAAKWMDVAKDFLLFQSKYTDDLLTSSFKRGEKNVLITNSILFITFLIFGCLTFWFSENISKKIKLIVEQLQESSLSMSISSEDVSLSSSKLSESATQAASSLQETVSSIDEISSMIERNSDASDTSMQVSSKSNEAAIRGKKTVESMIESINDISKSNDEIAREMKNSNEEISQIVKVISEIGEKTKVINDIVFQTKLLSFNASVEAARAGEHGKGFAVVAEEVGNLASMSGKSALEITEMLDSSIKQVTGIVENTQKEVGILISTSKEKVEIGTKTAHDCGNSIDEILQNVTTSNEMVREINSASKEQSTGVQEITKAMQQLDQVTHQNTSEAQQSSLMASRLQSQADGLRSIIADLMNIVIGSKKIDLDKKDQLSFNDQKSNVLKLPRKSPPKTVVKKISTLKVSGLDTEIPDESDDRFEDL